VVLRVHNCRSQKKIKKLGFAKKIIQIKLTAFITTNSSKPTSFLQFFDCDSLSEIGPMVLWFWNIQKTRTGGSLIKEIFKIWDQQLLTKSNTCPTQEHYTVSINILLGWHQSSNTQWAACIWEEMKAEYSGVNLEDHIGKKRGEHWTWGVVQHTGIWICPEIRHSFE
jgi:hypothetical protein